MNNQNGEMTAAEAAKQRQTIKKLTVGVSSILLGFAFAGATNAHADTTTPVNSNSENTVSVSDHAINANSNAQVLKSTANANSASATASLGATVSLGSSVSLNSAASAASDASSAAQNAAGDVKTPVADNYEAAVNAAVNGSSAASAANSASATADNNSAASSASSAASASTSSATANDSSAATENQNSASASSAATTANDNKTASEAPAATDPTTQLEVAPVTMTQYQAKPYGEAQREANAQAGAQILNDFVSIFTSRTITGKIGAGINFVKDTINLIAHHPLAYQRYQNMTARQIKYANQQHDLALKELRMKKAHKPQWQINFVIWEQRQLANWQRNLEIQRQTMISYLQEANSSSDFA